MHLNWIETKKKNQGRIWRQARQEKKSPPDKIIQDDEEDN